MYNQYLKSTKELPPVLTQEKEKEFRKTRSKRKINRREPSASSIHSKKISIYRYRQR